MRPLLRIVTARRVSQAFFVLLTLWLCAVSTLGAGFFRLSGWPVNFILSLSPLTALGTLLATRTWYAPLLWAVPVILLTAFLGRFFCGFACPLGALNQAAGWLARRVGAHVPGARGAALRARLADNGHSTWQAAKYYLLAFLLAAACFGSLQTGLFDPLPLVFRSLNMTVAPVVDAGFQALFTKPRHYASAWLLFSVFAGVLALNILRPRFFCRYVCPLGALFGMLNRFAPWRMGKKDDQAHGACGSCTLCDTYCEGACRPSGEIIGSECLMCMNCLDACPQNRMTFAPRASAGGETHLPEPTRRGFVVSLAAGALSAPLWTIGGLAETGKNPLLIRPPGALDETRFLSRCIRCGQCMRVCPTNVIQPALGEAGLEGLWTPVLNYRLGSSGCQVQCVACGHVCPTAAIRPLTLNEKLGQGPFAAKGPLRLGTAFVDRTRCLPWASDRPCLVCQELCPVSPKSIYTRTTYEPIRFGQAQYVLHQDARVSLSGLAKPVVNLGSGDYYLRPAAASGAQPMAAPEQGLRRINACTWAESGQTLTLDATPDAKQGWKLTSGDTLEILVRLQRPYVDPARCIGCGVCEHECPIAGLRGIRVSYENESRSGPGRMLV